jgi:hypothetical protein
MKPGLLTLLQLPTPPATPMSEITEDFPKSLQNPTGPYTALLEYITLS